MFNDFLYSKSTKTNFPLSLKSNILLICLESKKLFVESLVCRHRQDVADLKRLQTN